ncbi:hypothetical protein HNY73_005208 [Argiope bruennichi]|uniref:Uncharacterized protein n=1 Tax=Argiope bruennichi TaxID=94029 RepID=A0A8T0FGN1_ARGBR|nr:hypothetical protein HNY73_005208 [Argiope bruennichi]
MVMYRTNRVLSLRQFPGTKTGLLRLRLAALSLLITELKFHVPRYMTPSWRSGRWILQLNEQIALFIANAQKLQLLCLHFESAFADTSSFTNSRGSTFINVIGVKHLPRKEGWYNHFPTAKRELSKSKRANYRGLLASPGMKLKFLPHFMFIDRYVCTFQNLKRRGSGVGVLRSPPSVQLWDKRLDILKGCTLKKTVHFWFNNRRTICELIF